MDPEQLFNNFIKSNSNIYNISIDSIFQELYIYLESKNYSLPEENANDVQFNTVRQGKDFCMYIVKRGSDKTHYWKKIIKNT